MLASPGLDPHCASGNRFAFNQDTYIELRCAANYLLQVKALKCGGNYMYQLP
jgi:hypothetical protein